MFSDSFLPKTKLVTGTIAVQVLLKVKQYIAIKARIGSASTTVRSQISPNSWCHKTRPSNFTFVKLFADRKHPVIDTKEFLSLKFKMRLKSED